LKSPPATEHWECDWHQLAMTKLSSSMACKRLPNCGPDSYKHHWIRRVPEEASQQWYYENSATHWVLCVSTKRTATVSKLSTCQRFFLKWESTDWHQQMCPLDCHSTQAWGQLQSYGHSKVPPRTRSSLGIYGRVTLLVTISKSNLTVYNCKQEYRGMY
jgi:hypothetical protein